MQPGIVVAKVIHLQILYGLYHYGGYEVHILLYPAQALQRVEQHGSRSAKELSGLAGDYFAIGQLYRRGRLPGLLRPGYRRVYYGPVLYGYAKLVYEQLYLFSRPAVAHSLTGRAHGGVIAAYYLLTGGLAAYLIVRYAVSRHVHPHVRGRLVGGLAVYLPEHGVEHREYFHVPVVVDGGDAVVFKMEGVYHVHIVQIRRGCLVGNVYRMLERQVPYGECFELGIARADAPLVLMVKLGKAGSHLAAARAGSGHYYQRAGSLNVLVESVSLVADNGLYIVGVAGNRIVTVYLYAQLLQPALEYAGGALAAVLGENYAAHVQADASEGVYEPEHIQIVGYAQIASHLVLLDIRRVYGDDYLSLVLQLEKHAHLAVRLKARQHAGSVKVVEELSAKLQIQLAAELGKPVHNML